MWLTDMANVLRDAGLPVHEVPGWAGRGVDGDGLNSVQTIVIHHTAGAPTGDYPSLAVVRDGRPGLKGPLAQLGVGRGGTVYVVAGGQANHAGAVLRSHYGNAYAIGIEVESVGTGPAWPAVQTDSAARTAAALCRRYGLSAQAVLGHKEVCSPVGRKIDPVGIAGDMPAFRALVARYIINPEEGFLMALSDQEQQAVRDRIMGFLRQRWYTVDSKTGALTEAAPGAPGAIAATALDTMDGNYLVGLINAVERKVDAPAPVELTGAQLDAIADRIVARLGPLRFEPVDPMLAPPTE